LSESCLGVSARLAEFSDRRGEYEIVKGHKSVRYAALHRVGAGVADDPASGVGGQA
jgi:hypothetical protein